MMTNNYNDGEDYINDEDDDDCISHNGSFLRIVEKPHCSKFNILHIGVYIVPNKYTAILVVRSWKTLKLMNNSWSEWVTEWVSCLASAMVRPGT